MKSSTKWNSTPGNVSPLTKSSVVTQNRVTTFYLHLTKFEMAGTLQGSSSLPSGLNFLKKAKQLNI
jgi:hypothetical protein